MPPFQLLGCIGLCVLTGCQSLSYYRQAIQGQWQMVSQKQSVSYLIEQKNTPTKLKQALALSVSLRQFAADTLKLPQNGSYTDYLDLQRPYPVWSVVAVPRYSFKAHLWCYPLVGCLSYRGYFNHNDAKAEARRLQQQGWDVSLGGVSAYSTLGWFNDPLLNSFIYASEARLAGLIFHEQAHQLLYIPNDTAFNEAFATLVEQEGTRQWLQQHRPEGLARYLQQLQQEQQIDALLQQQRQRLEVIYASPYANKAEFKRQAFELFSQQLWALKSQYWPNDPSYDAWFKRPKNNADLLHQATYRYWLPAFLRLYHQQRSWPAFYQAAKRLAQLPASKRQQRLHELLNGADDYSPNQPQPAAQF